MKKLIIVLGLFIVFPAFAMELSIKNEDNHLFAQQLSNALVSSNKLIKDNKITQTNPIHVMLDKISHNFSSCDNDIVKMIKSHSLQYRIDEYKKIEFNPLIQSRLRQINNRHGDIKSTWDYIVTTRKLLAGLQLEKKQPGFHMLGFDMAWLDYMLDNQHYPVNEASFNDYTALCIYTAILAKKTS